jgi:hypothetical protein
MAEPAPITEGPILVEFTSETNEVPPGTPAAPRPPGRPRELEPGAVTDADATFAKELAERVLEYVQNRSGGVTAEQLAALVQQYLARRSA